MRLLDRTRAGSASTAPEIVSIFAFLRRLLRKLKPPGNRGSLDTEYDQPNGPGMGTPSEATRELH